MNPKIIISILSIAVLFFSGCNEVVVCGDGICQTEKGEDETGCEADCPSFHLGCEKESCIVKEGYGSDTCSADNDCKGELSEEQEEKLIREFGCNLGVDKFESIDKVIVYECLTQSDLSFGEEDFIYQIGAHPMGVWNGTYLVFDGEYTHVKEADALKEFFVPIENEEDAFDYLVLHEGLLWSTTVSGAPEAGETNTVKEGDVFVVTVLHGSRNMCPCYGTDWKSIYEVNSKGDITKKSGETIYSYSDPDCMC